MYGVDRLEVPAGHLAGAAQALLSSAGFKGTFGIFQQRQLLGQRREHRKKRTQRSLGVKGFTNRGEKQNLKQRTVFFTERWKE